MDEVKNSVLVVDDEKLNLKALTSILMSEYTIFTAKDGIDALHLAKEYQPDLILLDIIMPKMNGYEVLSELKRCDETRDIPVIFITGLNNAIDEEIGLAMEAADYIAKPFSATIVKLRVRNQIQIRNQLRMIERLSMTDQLTGLPNRRAFDNRLDHEWNHAIRVQKPLSILMLDIDRFKEYNDTYGHQQGDMALQKISKILGQVLKRSEDLAARWGGEEFVVLLNNTDSSGGMTVAESIRERIEVSKIPCADGRTTSLTASIGIHTQIPSNIDTSDAFVNCADEALYSAKRSGRNQVVAYENK